MGQKLTSFYKKCYNYTNVHPILALRMGGMKLLRKVLAFLRSRMFIVALLLILQFAFLFASAHYLAEFYRAVNAVFLILSIAVVLYIINRQDNPAYKLVWVSLILTVPIFGGLLYLIVGGNHDSRRFVKKLLAASDGTAKLLRQDPDVRRELAAEDSNMAVQSAYIERAAKYPVYKNTHAHYMPSGEAFFERLILELKKAKHYIFMEFFIIEEGLMWDTVLAILKQKAGEGLDVRMMYDDVGSLMTVPYRYDAKIREKGIKCIAFNPFVPSLSLRLNNRDHRKIVVIDGHTAFTGGSNLADEYINGYPKHGQWKEAMILLRGEASYSFTSMFLQTWKYYADRYYEEDMDYELYKPQVYMDEAEPLEYAGFIQPYGDSPVDDEQTSEGVYLNLVTKASRYIYIATPYFVVGNELLTAICMAAKSGVDVRILTPHVADKVYVHATTRSYYRQLVEAGVRVYEYTPGFVHSKLVVVDDKVCTVGTVNMDFRSLYLHFECGVWVYQNAAVQAVRDDLVSTYRISQEITLEDTKAGLIMRLVNTLLRLFAPLM